MKLIEVARFTPNVSEVTRFYEGLLDRKADRQYEGMAEFQLGDVVLRVHKTYDVQKSDLPPEDHVAFAVEDLAVACQRAELSGLVLEVPPTRYQWGMSAYLRDPDGRLVELHEVRPIV